MIVYCIENQVNGKRYVLKLGTFGAGYNMTRGGDGISGYTHSDDAKQRMSESRRGKKNCNYGKRWGRKGPHIEETKRKLSLANSGRKHTKEARNKISIAQYVEVQQLTFNGSVVATFESMIEAENKTGVDRRGISRACRQSHRSAGGFKWRYKR